MRRPPAVLRGKIPSQSRMRERALSSEVTTPRPPAEQPPKRILAPGVLPMPLTETSDWMVASMMRAPRNEKSKVVAEAPASPIQESEEQYLLKQTSGTELVQAWTVVVGSGVEREALAARLTARLADTKATRGDGGRLAAQTAATLLVSRQGLAQGSGNAAPRVCNALYHHHVGVRPHVVGINCVRKDAIGRVGVFSASRGHVRWTSSVPFLAAGAIVAPVATLGPRGEDNQRILRGWAAGAPGEGASNTAFANHFFHFSRSRASTSR